MISRNILHYYRLSGNNEGNYPGLNDFVACVDYLIHLRPVDC